MMTWNPGLTPLFGKLQYEITEKGLKKEDAMDIYGWSKNMLLYIKPTTLHVTANGYAIITNRNDVQQVIFDFYTQFKILIEKYETRGRYPMNGPIEIRVTGLDKTDHILNESAVTANLSALRPDPEHPEWDVAIWLDVLTIPGTRHANEFYQEMENWIFSHYVGSYATARAEWSKGWGYTKDAAWTNPEAIARIKSDAAWSTADKTLAKYDPYRLFSSDLLDKILG
jgi:FAD/FMN-containing dehydrogenase